jgi:hypothetical protein
MANPNIVNVTTITGNTSGNLLFTTANTILSNAGGSSLVMKVDSIVVTNVSANAANISVSWNNAAAGGGTPFYLANNISVPSQASLIVTDKTTAFYLPENTSVVALAGANNALYSVITYESIS